MRRGWKDDEIAKVAGENLLRVMSAAETVRAKLQHTESASLVTIAELDGSTQKDK
jgi:membrane dipeptidase